MQIPEWKLERYLLGELDATELSAIEGQLAAAPRERKRLEILEKQYREIREQLPFRKLFPNQKNIHAGAERGPVLAFLFSRTGLALAALPLVIGAYFISWNRKEPASPATGGKTGYLSLNNKTTDREKDIDSFADENKTLGGNDGDVKTDGVAPDRNVPYSERIVRESPHVSSKTTSEQFEGHGFTPEGPAGTEATIPLGYKDRDYQKADSNAVNLRKGKKAEETAKVERKIIRTGNLHVEVSSVKDSLAKIKNSLAELGGHVENENISKDANDHAYAHLVLRIPAARFENFMAGSGAFGKILNQSAHSQDATRDYFDTELRLKNDLELKNRLIHVLNTRSGKLSDILEIETELARVTERIELSKGSLRYYDAVVGMSRIDLQLKEPDSVIENGRPSTLKRIGASFGRAWYLFTDLLTFAIASLGVLIPLALAGFIGVKLFRKYRARRGA